MLTVTYRIVGNRIACSVARDGVEIEARLVDNSQFLGLLKWRQRRYPDAKTRSQHPPMRARRREQAETPRWL